MAGLRDRQKEMRRKAITDAALALFEKQGFNGTTVEQIAVMAGVSAPTVFNYFGTKQQIILDIIREMDEATLLHTQQKLSSFNDPVEALCYIDEQGTLFTLRVLPVSLWREVLPLMFSPGSPFCTAYQELNQRFKDEVSTLLVSLIERGLIRGETNVEVCVQAMLDISHMQLFRLVSQDEPDLAGHRRHMRSVAEIFIQGLRN
ncbi:TPA: TetR/AcrR family transcriptional regulator [Pseudomonas aeruginosa]